MLLSKRDISKGKVRSLVGRARLLRLQKDKIKNMNVRLQDGVTSINQVMIIIYLAN